MSGGVHEDGGFVNGRCYAEKAPQNEPPLYHNGDFQFQGAVRIGSIFAWLAYIRIFSPPSKAMFHLWAIFR